MLYFQSLANFIMLYFTCIAEMNEDVWLHSVRVLNVLPDVVELVELYLESPQKGGGDFEKFTYNAESQHVTVVFVDPKGMLMSLGLL